MPDKERLTKDEILTILKIQKGKLKEELKVINEEIRTLAKERREL